MAIYTDAGSEYLARTLNLPGIPHTFSGWARIRADRGALVVQPIAACLDASFVGWSFSWSGDVQASSMVITTLTTGGAEFDFAYFPSRPPVGAWFYWYVRVSGTGTDQVEAGWRLLGSDTWITAVVTIPAFTPTQFHLSDIGGAGAFWSNEAHAHVRCANVVRTPAQLLTESKSTTPVILTDQNFSWRLASVATLGDTDLSPNNREPTVGGTLSDEADPAIEPVPGTATAGLANGWLVTASATDAAGGAAPYTYQWQRSPRNAATWTNITGQTTLNLVDRTVAASTNYDYRLRYTGNNGTQSFSNTLAINVPAQAAVWTVTGDSQTDEYRADDNRGAGTWQAFILNWLEQLAEPSGASGVAVHDRNLNFGVWGTRAEPRRTGFANNWARSGSTMETLLADQLAGAAAQVSGGTSTHAALWCTANEWVNPNAVAGYYQYINEIYNSPDGVNTDTLGITIAQVVDDVATRITDTIDAFVNAGVAGMAVVLVPDFMIGPMYITAYPDATRRGYVSSAIADIATQVNAHVATINTAAGVTVVTTSDAGELFGAIWATADGTYATVAGLRINYVEESNNQGPLYFAIVPDGGVGISHPGAIAQSVYANVFLLAANDLPGIAITPYSDAEMRENAGIDHVASLAVTEQSDTFAAEVETVTEIEASLAVTEAADTIAVTGDVLIAASLAVTEASDSFAADTEVRVAVAMAVTEGADTFSASGEVEVQGDLVVTEAADTIAVSADVVITISLAVTEANDTIAVNASAGRQATLTVTEAIDTFAATVEVEIVGSLAVSETSDTVAVDVDVVITGNLAVSEASDTIAADGNVFIEGFFAVTEEGDTIFVNASSSITGSMDATEAPDTFAAEVEVAVAGALAVTESNDGFAADSEVFVEGALAVTEQNDTIAVNASSALQITMAVTEAPDSISVDGDVLIGVDALITEQADTFASTVSIAIEGFMAVTEEPDTVAITIGSGDRGIDIELLATYTPRISLQGVHAYTLPLNASQE